MGNLNIHTKRLTIRNLKTKDLNDFYVYRSNPEVMMYQGTDTMNKLQAEKFIEGQTSRSFGKPGEWVQYGIELIKTKTLVGDCAVKLEAHDPRIGQIGITINPDHQKKGLAKEAMIGLMTWLFEIKKIHRIFEIVDVENYNSIKLLESLHFRKEGHTLESFFINNKWGSEFQYAMLNGEWKDKSIKLHIVK